MKSLFRFAAAAALMACAQPKPPPAPPQAAPGKSNYRIEVVTAPAIITPEVECAACPKVPDISIPPEQLLADFDPEPIYFALGSHLLEEPAKVEHLARRLLQGAIQVKLVGHACPLGASAYNRALGSRRARAVYDALRRHGVPAEQLRRASEGESWPATLQVADYWKNRRVEIHILEYK